LIFQHHFVWLWWCKIDLESR